MNQLAICGTWNNSGGKASGYMKKFFEFSTATVYNGGTWDELTRILYEEVPHYNVVYWFPDVPNDKPKLVGDVKDLAVFSHFDHGGKKKYVIWPNIIPSPKNCHYESSLEDFVEYKRKLKEQYVTLDARTLS